MDRPPRPRADGHGGAQARSGRRGKNRCWWAPPLAGEQRGPAQGPAGVSRCGPAWRRRRVQLGELRLAAPWLGDLLELDGDVRAAQGVSKHDEAQLAAAQSARGGMLVCQLVSVDFARSRGSRDHQGIIKGTLQGSLDTLMSFKHLGPQITSRGPRGQENIRCIYIGKYRLIRMVLSESKKEWYEQAITTWGRHRHSPPLPACAA